MSEIVELVPVLYGLVVAGGIAAFGVCMSIHTRNAPALEAKAAAERARLIAERSR